MSKDSADAGRLTPITAYVAEKLRCGVASMDRFGIRYRVAHWAVVVFGERASLDLRIPRACMAVVYNETRGLPPFVGDALLPGGPSIGPMQVYRRTAKEEGLWKPSKPHMLDKDERAEYRELANDLDLGIQWGVKVFAKKFQYAKEDIGDAVRRYNGAGAEAIKYRARALLWASERWGDITKPPTGAP